VTARDVAIAYLTNSALAIARRRLRRMLPAAAAGRAPCARAAARELKFNKYYRTAPSMRTQTLSSSKCSTQATVQLQPIQLNSKLKSKRGFKPRLDGCM
jgi:hypothetical protein